MGHTTYSQGGRSGMIGPLWIAVLAVAIGHLPSPVWPGGVALAESEFSVEEIEFFENKVRPVLAEHCYDCHSGKAKTVQGNLRLDTRAAALAGGDSGPAVVPGQPGESLLIESVRWQSYEMPPQGKLSEDQLSMLAKWVEMGVPWPSENTRPNPEKLKTYDWEQLRDGHWAFRPVAKPPLPTVRGIDWPRNEIDRFVLVRLEDAGLQPAPPADPRTFVRRVYLDLIGLPPTPAEIDQWTIRLDAARPDSHELTDDAGPSNTARLDQQAIADLIDHLLGSPHYGERWGRYWLDVARYSDGYGGFLDNAALLQAWRYRDWIVAALNQDLPVDEFIRQQIAGDLLTGTDGAVASGFFALGPTYRSDGGDPDSVAQAKAETLADRVDTLGRGMLGLTLACARCHDHKFDPVPQEDYYSLAGVFNNTRVQETPLAPPEVVKSYGEHQKAIADLEQKIKKRKEEIKKDGREPNDAEKGQLDQWQAELDELKRSAPPKYDTAHALADTGSGDMKVAIRGDLRKPGAVAPRRFLQILSRGDPQRFTQGSGRRELAEAVVDPKNPLTARVFVNRVWMHHFGKALVRTPSNFGSLGEKPTHPMLMDWLTMQFIRSGWSLKQLHRTIMQSATYQMSSRFDEHSFQVDGDNRLLWRMNLRRLDVEAWRDSLLAVTGELDRTLGGPPTDRPDSRRRTLYLRVSRNGDQFASDEFLRLFDFPLMRATVARRPTSIVPQQYLFMMNSPLMHQRAAALAARLKGKAGDDPRRIDLAYHLLYGRAPSVEEARIGLDYVTAESDSTSLSAWQQYAQVLLSANEFMSVH